MRNSDFLVTELASSTFPREQNSRIAGLDQRNFIAWNALADTSTIWPGTADNAVPGFSPLLRGQMTQAHTISWMAVVAVLVVLWLIWRMAE